VRKTRLRRAAGRLWYHFHWRALYLLAYPWRSFLWRTTVVAITGSAGKTTAKECLMAMLATVGPTAGTVGNENGKVGVPRSVLRVRPWHRFAVIEVATSEPGMIRRSGRLVRPHVAVVLSVASQHRQSFRTLEATAAEKGALLATLSRGGAAVLNGDDPRLAAMAVRQDCATLVFGRSPGFAVWADGISAVWPARLCFRLHTATGSAEVRTRLVGEHWVTAVLGAATAALECGVPLEVAARALGSVEPGTGRMQPVELPCGATFLRDEFDACIDTLSPALAALAAATAVRKILVFSDVTDTPRSPRKRVKAVARWAAANTQLAVFVGEHGSAAATAAVAAGMSPERARWFGRLEEAARFLAGELKLGDLVLLRGRTCDHISRLALAQTGEVACWKTTCRKRIVCDVCPELRQRPRRFGRPGCPALSVRR
jgi:UDP-N-acetylmuramoyl-tripeptide--D-alanyl-D-alanine ligase